jgi:hypothetical protein
MSTFGGRARLESKWQRLLKRGQSISDQLLTDAAAFRHRLTEINRQYPDVSDIAGVVPTMTVIHQPQRRLP